MIRAGLSPHLAPDRLAVGSAPRTAPAGRGARRLTGRRCAAVDRGRWTFDKG
ncbi:MAG: hypothetical protein LBE67_13855 [Kocuria palustris]|nr:hypothetical protein [Kocuria palustris]